MKLCPRCKGHGHWSDYPGNWYVCDTCGEVGALNDDDSPITPWRLLPYRELFALGMRKLVGNTEAIKSEIRGTDQNTETNLATSMDAYKAIELKIAWEIASFPDQTFPTEVRWIALRVLAHDVVEHERLGKIIKKKGFPLPI